jgi:hypothetical protein
MLMKMDCAYSDSIWPTVPLLDSPLSSLLSLIRTNFLFRPNLSDSQSSSRLGRLIAFYFFSSGIANSYLRESAY